MKSKSLLLLVLPFVMYVSGCNKKAEDEPVPADRTSILTSGTWRFTSMYETWEENGTSKSEEVLPSCVADNFYSFSSEGLGFWDNGALKCDPSDPQQQNFNWSLSDNDTKLTFGDLTLEILEMTNTQFRVRRIYNDGDEADVLMVTQTLTFNR
jgi:hypothetical protein